MHVAHYGNHGRGGIVMPLAATLRWENFGYG